MTLTAEVLDGVDRNQEPLDFDGAGSLTIKKGKPG
jgi:hypothetical protein